MRTALQSYRTRSTGTTVQTQPIIGETMVQNSAGGYAYQLDEWKQLERFLILGTEGGTAYVTEKTLTLNNAKTVRKLIDKDGPRVVAEAVGVSLAGRAARNDAAIFVLAMAGAFGNPETKRAVKLALPRVARTGTHLFTFVEFSEQFRGWGRGLRDTVANWYLRHGTENIASVEAEKED